MEVIKGEEMARVREGGREGGREGRKGRRACIIPAVVNAQIVRPQLEDDICGKNWGRKALL